MVPLLAGLALVAVVTAMDVKVGRTDVVIGLVLLGPFTTALFGSARQTVVVGVLASVLALASGAWDDNVATVGYVLRAITVPVGAAVAVLIASARADATRRVFEQALLSAMTELVGNTETVAGMVERVVGLLVPAVADLVIVEVNEHGGRRHVGVRCDGPDRAADELHLRAQVEAGLPWAVADRPVTAPRLVTVTDDLLGGGGEPERWRALGLREVSEQPLRAAGRLLGSVTLGVTTASGRRYSEADVAFLTRLTDRAALVFDRAGVSGELRDLERQLEAALGGLDEAVSVTDPSGRTVYANAAALRLLGFARAEELYAAPPETVMERYDVLDESGRALDLAAMPGSRLQAGERDVPPLLVRNIVRATGEERWLVTKSSAVRDDDGAVLRIVNVIEDVTAIKRAEASARLRVAVNEALTAPAGSDRTALERLAEAVVDGHFAQWCSISLLDREGRAHSRAVAHRDADAAAAGRVIAARESAHRTAGLAFADGVWVLNEVTDAWRSQVADDDEHLELLRRLNLDALMVVEIRPLHEVVGTIVFGRSRPAPAFGEHEVEVAREIARSTGAALERARLYRDRTQITRELQAALRPPDLPEMDGWAAAALYRPVGDLNDVGGDFYEIVETPWGWAAVMGDVTGHGALAAKLTALARFTLRSTLQLTGDPLRAAGALNAALLAEPELSLSSAVCLLLNEQPGGGAQVRFVACGHPLPVVLGARGPETVGRGGPLLGAFEDARWEPTTVQLTAGQTLVLYTDGITDIVGRSGRLELEGLLQVLDGAPDQPDRLIRHVEAALEAERRGVQRDDEALLAIQAPGPSASV